MSILLSTPYRVASDQYELAQGTVPSLSARIARRFASLFSHLGQRNDDSAFLDDRLMQDIGIAREHDDLALAGYRIPVASYTRKANDA